MAEPRVGRRNSGRLGNPPPHRQEGPLARKTRETAQDSCGARLFALLRARVA
jgi:hypothetical protein